MKFMWANRIAPDGMPRFAASNLGLFCLPMSHKKDARLIWVKKSEKMLELYLKFNGNSAALIYLFVIELD